MWQKHKQPERGVSGSAQLLQDPQWRKLDHEITLLKDSSLVRHQLNSTHTHTHTHTQTQPRSSSDFYEIIFHSHLIIRDGGLIAKRLHICTQKWRLIQNVRLATIKLRGATLAKDTPVIIWPGPKQSCFCDTEVLVVIIVQYIHTHTHTRTHTHTLLQMSIWIPGHWRLQRWHISRFWRPRWKLMKLSDMLTMTFISLQPTLKVQLHYIIFSHLNHTSATDCRACLSLLGGFGFFLPVSNCAGEGKKKICSSFSANWEHVGA